MRYASSDGASSSRTRQTKSCNSPLSSPERSITSESSANRSVPETSLARSQNSTISAAPRAPRNASKNCRRAEIMPRITPPPPRQGNRDIASPGGRSSRRARFLATVNPKPGKGTQCIWNSGSQDNGTGRGARRQITESHATDAKGAEAYFPPLRLCAFV